MKKYLLSVLIILNACSLVSTAEEDNTPTIGPKLYLKEENSIEKWLKGEWRFTRYSDTTKHKYIYGEELGKQFISYKPDGVLGSCVSYEVKEEYFTNEIDGQTTITHLIIEYVDDPKELAWNEYPLYREVERLSDNESIWYLRGYPKGTLEEDFMKNPRATGRDRNVEMRMERI
ncbi:MAG: hypothetical protein ACRC0X_10175 [Brevinema sp.]